MLLNNIWRFKILLLFLNEKKQKSRLNWFFNGCEASSSNDSEQATGQITDSNSRQCSLGKTIYDEYEGCGKMIELAVIIQLLLTTSSCDDLKKEDDYDGT